MRIPNWVFQRYIQEIQPYHHRQKESPSWMVLAALAGLLLAGFVIMTAIDSPKEQVSVEVSEYREAP